MFKFPKLLKNAMGIIKIEERIEAAGPEKKLSYAFQQSDLRQRSEKVWINKLTQKTRKRNNFQQR